MEVDRDTAREKVSHYFRRLRSLGPTKRPAIKDSSSEQKQSKSKRRSVDSPVSQVGGKSNSTGVTTTVLPLHFTSGHRLLSTESGKRTKLMAL